MHLHKTSTTQHKTTKAPHLVDVLSLTLRTLNHSAEIAPRTVFHDDVNLCVVAVDDSVIVPDDVGVSEVSQDVDLAKRITREDMGRQWRMRIHPYEFTQTFLLINLVAKTAMGSGHRFQQFGYWMMADTPPIRSIRCQAALQVRDVVGCDCPQRMDVVWKNEET